MRGWDWRESEPRVAKTKPALGPTDFAMIVDGTGWGARYFAWAAAFSRVWLYGCRIGSFLRKENIEAKQSSASLDFANVVC